MVEFGEPPSKVLRGLSRLGLAIRDFAATAVALVARSEETLVAHVGDGAAVVRGSDAEWRVASWPDAGEFAGTTFFVTDDGGARIRIARLGAAITEAALFTDGLERLALSFADRRPHAPFFDGMMRPLAARGTTARSAEVSGKLAAYLAGEAVCARTDDDKTLVLARRG